MLAAIIGFGLSVLATQMVLDNETSRLRLEMERRVENHMRALEYGMIERVRLIENSRVLFGISGEVSHNDFHVFFDRIDFAWSNATALAWAPAASGKKTQDVTVSFCAPNPVCRDSLSSHLLTKGDWQPALLRARQSGETSAVNLSDRKTEQEANLGIITPLFQRAGIGAPQPDDGKRPLVGYIIGIFSIPGMIEETLGTQTAPSGLDVYFFKGTKTSPEKLVYFHKSRSAMSPRSSPAEDDPFGTADFIRSFKVANLEWTVVFRPVPEAFSRLKSNEAIEVFIFGFLMTVLFSTYLVLSVRRTSKIEELVTARTIELNVSEERLRAARDQAEQANIAKSKFLAAASHDLRQPLQAMNLFLNVLSGRDQGRKSQEIIGHLKDSVGSLEGLLNALLSISKLEAGLIIPEKSDFLLGPIFQRFEDEFRPLFKKAGLRLRAVKPSLAIHSDPALLERILRNLLANALRYTETGHVLLGARRHGAFLQIGIWDTGIGIPEDQQEAIFKEFYQIARGDEDDDEGVGLGLAIVARLGKLLGSDINVTSKPGKGSAFTLNVPLAENPMSLASPSVQTSDAALAFSIAGKVVLVVDDEEKVRLAMRYQLESWGGTVMTATSTDDALSQVAERVPDLILADYRLHKGETGHKAIKALRKKVKKEITGILFTGDTAPKRLQKAKKSGLQLLHKPVSPEDLQTAIQAELEKATAGKTDKKKNRRKAPVR